MQRPTKQTFLTSMVDKGDDFLISITLLAKAVANFVTTLASGYVRTRTLHQGRAHPEIEHSPLIDPSRSCPFYASQPSRTLTSTISHYTSLNSPSTVPGSSGGVPCVPYPAP
jgi:hypothetical protein